MKKDEDQLSRRSDSLPEDDALASKCATDNTHQCEHRQCIFEIKLLHSTYRPCAKRTQNFS
jgi:hypothetical protein